MIYTFVSPKMPLNSGALGQIKTPQNRSGGSVDQWLEEEMEEGNTRPRGTSPHPVDPLDRVEAEGPEA